MHLGDARQDACKRVEPLLSGEPAPHFYTVISTSARRASPAA
jgi:hypothetical protein